MGPAEYPWRRVEMEHADYRRIADDIQRKIETGELKAGVKLSSTAELAARYDVSTSTIYRSVILLRDRGVVQGHAGKGVFVR